MRLVALLVVAVVGCGTSPHRGATRIDLHAPQFDTFVDEVIAASASQTPARTRSLLRDGVVVGGLWFDDIECVKQFAAPSEVKGARLDALARCLATLSFKRSERVDPLPDVAVLEYGPGIEIEARIVELDGKPWLAWIGYVARRDTHDAIPTITERALQSRRVSGDTQPVVGGPSLAGDIAMGGHAYALIKVCVDSAGTVTGAHVREASSPVAARLFIDGVKTWQFKPFTANGQAIPVCSVVETVFPPETAIEKHRLPLPLPADPQPIVMVPSKALGALVQGTKYAVPDDSDKTLVARSRLGRVVGAFEFCVGETGHVYRVQVLRSTGLPHYDQTIIDTIGGWEFKPYLDEGQPSRVCSSATFVYTQDRLPAALR